jgi:4a-hydroxytetrahydrobiopterin dehydratase
MERLALIRAQTLGDYEVLIDVGRKVLCLHLPSTQSIKLLVEATVQWWTHRIKGLHKNDFIMAAKSDEIFNP